jgi:hypothetical protein
VCPLCIANIAVLGTTSSGGVAALALKTFRSRGQLKQERQKELTKEGHKSDDETRDWNT